MNQTHTWTLTLEQIRARDSNRHQPGNQFDQTTWLGNVGHSAVRDRRWLLTEVDRLTAIIRQLTVDAVPLPPAGDSAQSAVRETGN